MSVILVWSNLVKKIKKEFMALRIYLEKVVGENCASIDDGDKVFQLVRPELVKGFQVEIDFKGINLMLTPFLNACFGKLLEQFGREITMTEVSMRNISNELLQRINDFISKKEFNIAKKNKMKIFLMKMV